MGFTQKCSKTHISHVFWHMYCKTRCTQLITFEKREIRVFFVRDITSVSQHIAVQIVD